MFFSKMKYLVKTNLKFKTLVVISWILILYHKDVSGSDALEIFQRTVSIFNSFDTFYHNVRKDPEYLRKIEPRGSDYAHLLLGYHMASSAEEAAELGYDVAEECEIRDHYNYLMSNDFRETPKIQSFVNMYTSYLSFWATINFKICSLVYELNVTSSNSSGMKREKRANLCKYLHRYLHWYTFLNFEKKVFDFKANFGEHVKSKIIAAYGKMFKSKNKSRTTVDTVSPILFSMDLKLILDSTYQHSAFSYLTRGDFEDKIIDIDYVKREFGPILEKTDCLDTDDFLDVCSIFKRLRGKPVIYINDDERYYYYLYRNVISLFREEELMMLENYFSLVLTGSSTQKKERFDLIPPYKLSKQLWDSLEIFENIKNLNTEKPRRIYNLERSPKMHRSNPIEILREMERLKIIYEYRNNESTAETPSFSKFIQDLDRITEGNKFSLKKATAEHTVDYVFES